MTLFKCGVAVLYGSCVGLSSEEDVYPQEGFPLDFLWIPYLCEFVLFDSLRVKRYNNNIYNI